LRQQVGPGVDQALCKSAAILACEDDLLNHMTCEVMDTVVLGLRPGEFALLDRPGLAALHPALARRVIEQIWIVLGARPRHAHVLALIDAAVGRQRGELHFSQGTASPPQAAEDCTLPIPRGPGETWRGNRERFMEEAGQEPRGG